MFGSQVGFVLWLALGCELSGPKIGQQAARPASRIHQEEILDSILASKLSSSSIPAQYNHGPLTQIAHRRESLNELRTVAKVDKMLDQPQVRFFNSWLIEWQMKIVENEVSKPSRRSCPEAYCYC